MIKLRYLLIVTIFSFLLAGCSSKGSTPSALISGNITVADSVDNTGDYSGIELAIIHKDSAAAEADTMFYQVTDSSGHFSGKAKFPEKKFYDLLVDRNNSRVGRASVILADGDTLRITGTLPDLDRTIEIESREHNALQTIQRLNRTFRRVSLYIQSGKLSGDSLTAEVRKWADLYWETYENHKGTLASQMAAREAIDLYSSLDGQLMMEKLNQVRDSDELANLTAQYSTRYLTDTRGLDYALSYLDTLGSITEEFQARKRIQQQQIKLLYDSARVEEAKKQLEAFKENFGKERDARKWAENIGYDLNYLSPGDTLPDFSFEYEGMAISRDSLVGTPYILEITLLSNKMYQSQYDRTFVIHNIYKNFGLQVITIPLDQSQITIEAFFDERTKAWPVADANSVDRKEIIEKFNIRFVPTRFLVDEKGEIVRKYIGREYQDIIKGIQTIIRKKEPAS